jgi:endonuclease III
MNTKIINKIFETFNSKESSPKTELTFANDYTLLVAVVLSAQSTDVQVNKATMPLFKVVKTPSDMIKLGEGGLIKYVKSIGLYRTKTRNVIRLSEMLIEKYKSKIPSSFEELKTLPGVGNKTAKIILNAVFDQPTIAVDTHVFRVSRRLGLTKKDSIPTVEKDLEKIIPKKWKPKAHHWLVLHGRYICKARKPLCDKCLVKKYCEYFKIL